jgi:protein-L-isoaspartate(D-aspartate) O-methyltransferase
MADSESAEALRQALVKALKEKGELTDPRLEAAFLSVPRDLFLPDLPLDKAYADEALPIKRDSHGMVLSSSSQPSMMALMLRQLRLRLGDNVLEIGAGTGYNAAVMHYLVGEGGHVTAIELDQELARLASDHLQRASMGDVQVVHADGAIGYAPRASYDRIIATVGIWDVPEAWVKQLKPNGILVAPIWLEAFQVSAAFTVQTDGTLFSAMNLPCGFIHLRGVAAGPPVYMRVGSTVLTLASNAVEDLDSAALQMLLSEDQETSFLNIPLKSSEYWHGFLPFLVLNIPQDYIFAVYGVDDEQQAYGLSGHGFALIGPGSACFVPYQGQGETRGFGGADAFMALQDCIQSWDAQGRPGSKALRLRLIPRDQAVPAVSAGKLYTRHDHYLHAWLAKPE